MEKLLLRCNIYQVRIVQVIQNYKAIPLYMFYLSRTQSIGVKIMVREFYHLRNSIRYYDLSL